LVLIGLKTTANAEFSLLLPPLVGSHTAILTLQNGLGNEEQLAQLFPVEQILGGLCFVCLNRLGAGLIHHIDHGLVIVGEFERWPEPRTHEIAAAFRHAGVPCSVADSLARAHWEKLTWNIPFNGLGVAGAAGFEAVISGEWPSPVGTAALPAAAGAPTEHTRAGKQAGSDLQPCLTTDRLLNDERWASLLRELMLEVVLTARAIGHPLSDSIINKQIERTRTMGAYRASTLLDFERGQPLELESLFLEPLRRARKVGVPVPRLEALCQVLQRLEQSRHAAGSGFSAAFG
jgi:2-dehydropantoate 2-reductase